MKFNKYIMVTSLSFSLLLCGCEKKEEIKKEENNKYAEVINYKEALDILKEGVTAEVLDIDTGVTYNVKRVIGGFNTLADVETLTKEDTEKLLSTTSNNKWSIKRRAVILTVGDKKIAASIAPFEHSGDESKPYGEIIDNRSGATGTGINLDSIRNNNMVGVVDIYFYNSLTPGVNKIDERHQEMVLKASKYEQ